MKYALIFLLLLVGCKTVQVDTQPFEIAIPEGVQIPADSVFEYPNGYRAKLIEGKLIAFPPPVIRKQKIKGSFNTKAKGEAQVGAGHVKVEAPKKQKADIIGDGNSQIKPDPSGKFDWIKWVCVAVIVVVLGYVFYPFLKIVRK